jgi:hypothetical protein
VYISCNVKNIWFQTFYRCKNLSSVTFGSSSIVIGDEAFRECGFTSLVIPDSVTAIGYGAFESCNNLTSAIIGNGVTSIGNGIFSFCNKLTNITIGSINKKISNTIDTTNDRYIRGWDMDLSYETTEHADVVFNGYSAMSGGKLFADPVFNKFLMRSALLSTPSSNITGDTITFIFNRSLSSGISGYIRVFYIPN